MNRDLMLAVLAMDSYETNGDGAQIGNATIVRNSDTGSQTGFKGVAYSYNGETIISFAGTNDFSDVWYGYGGGFGVGSTQAEQAAAFFWEVNGGASVPYSSNVTFTGHSLGGGIAGLMAGLYGKEAVVFDNMA